MRVVEQNWWRRGIKHAKHKTGTLLRNAKALKYASALFCMALIIDSMSIYRKMFGISNITALMFGI